ncbi:MAG: antibiotic biosynthesis monooxygenase [Balneolia bacterium]|nr:antibiotic biosynthesis monooxygenase [Balneolia bacterium]
MYLRMVEATLKAGAEEMLAHVYAGRILSALENTPGCIFAGLLHSLDQPDKYTSLTLWHSEHDARAYEESGRFRENLDSVKEFIEESGEWKIQLSEDNTVEYSPVPAEPSVKRYPVAGDEEHFPAEATRDSSYLRIVSLKINKGCKDEFTEIYTNEILPELKQVKGCRYAFLLDNSDQKSEMISFSVWDGADDVLRYEKEGAYKRFLKKLDHTLGGLYQWKVALENRSKSKSAVTSQDIGISKFTLITGRKFK